MNTQKKKERGAAYKGLREKIGAILREQHDALPVPRSDLLDDLMRRVEIECSKEKRQLH
jgi:hypothetical protein